MYILKELDRCINKRINMMGKWADYCITKVQYNTARTHIVKVFVYEDKGDTLGTGEELTRAKVVSSIENRKTFVTIFKNTEGKWTRGANVCPIVVKGTTYIRTDQHS